ncbi:MAG: Fe-S protein assembly chaperone HscA [Alphaproteobacteria bacterium]|jgi:molecular chaperone HscA|nr:Fe-S protein assembly chaperone HscA [Thalassospira sp.]MCE2965238.1 Fe-S protein assembly chaperone HscA [Alphaproteobacteria bacterium]
MLLQIHEPGETPEPHSLGGNLAIGIDLGTTNSVVSWIDTDDVPVVATDAEDRPLLPSVVYYPAGKDPIVGYAALPFLSSDPARTLASTKRLMGRAATDFNAAELPFTLENPADSKTVRLHVGGTKTLSPVDVAATLLKTLKTRAEEALRQSVTSAVITVPAYFDDAARQATKDAAQLAGLAVLRLINEPTAAALAYGLDKGDEGLFSVYDLGGGTFDVSVLRLQKGVFQVLATGGDTALGGDDMDAAMAAAYLAAVSLDTPISTHERQQLLQACRTARESLTTSANADINLFLAGRDCSHRFVRADIERLIQPLLERTFAITADVLREAGLSAAGLNGVILVGGTTRIPAVRSAAAAFFGTKVFADVNPDEVVAVGAARQAKALTQGSSTVLLDVNPLSLGLEMMGGLVEKIIPRNSPIPIAKAQDFTTYADGQTALLVHVLQGERETVDTCRSLARLTLSGIPAMPAGAARIRVTFTVDADGLLTVSAQEQTTGVYQTVAVQPSYGLDDDTMRTMLMDSLIHAGADMSDRLLREQRVEAERVLNALAVAEKKDGDLLRPDWQAGIVAAATALRNAAAETDREAIHQAIEALEKAARPFVEARINRALKNSVAGETVESVAIALKA